MTGAGDLATQLAAGKRHVYTTAVQLVQRRLEEIAAQHGVPQATLHTLWAEVGEWVGWRGVCRLAGGWE